MTTVRVERDLTFRDIEPLLTLVSAAAPNAERRSVALPNGTRPGFLVALTDLVKQSVDSYGATRTPAAVSNLAHASSVRLLRRVLRAHDESSELLKSATIDGRAYSNVARGDFEIRQSDTGETTRFQLTYGTSGPLAAVPVHAVYQPRWWLEVQLFLDDRTGSSA